jgi:hypothetical protein
MGYANTLTTLLRSPRGETPKLEIKTDATKMVFVRNAVIKPATNAAQLFDLYERGNA